MELMQLLKVFYLNTDTFIHAVYLPEYFSVDLQLSHVYYAPSLRKYHKIMQTDEMQIEFQIPAVWLLCHLPRLQAARRSSHHWPGIFSAFDIYKKLID